MCKVYLITIVAENVGTLKLCSHIHLPLGLPLYNVGFVTNLPGCGPVGVKIIVKKKNIEKGGGGCQGMCFNFYVKKFVYQVTFLQVLNINFIQLAGYSTGI